MNELERVLQRATKDYWDYYDPENLDKSIKEYINPTKDYLKVYGKSLLEAELEYASQKGRIIVQRRKTLVLMVGYSLEPLLQSVCVYKPQKVVLLLNQDGYEEEWHVFAQHLIEAIGHLVEKGLLDRPPEFPGERNDQGYPVEDKPHAVFQKLVEVLKDETDVVIDVTGGKKSMVGGAYMYAAYAGTGISYVDFDEYDPEHRRPYGYTCKIDGLSNPYEDFALREWERVRALYGRYQFHEAKQVLDAEIRPAMDKWPQESTEAIEQLSNILHFYDLWDSGNYREVHVTLSTLPRFKAPDAVTVLGPGWYEFQNDQITQIPCHFYDNVRNVQVYVCDELDRINRLIKHNEDYRSAFLRAAGLNEVVLVARLVDYAVPSIRQTLLDVLDMETPSARKLFRSLTNQASNFSWQFFKAVTKDQFGKSMNVPLIRQMGDWWSNTNYPRWEDFLDYRNKLAHTYFSVPKKWAEDALAFVRANIQDFWRSVEEMDIHTDALPWPELCELTGVAEFLPQNLRKEA